MNVILSCGIIIYILVSRDHSVQVYKLGIFVKLGDQDSHVYHCKGLNTTSWRRDVNSSRGGRSINSQHLAASCRTPWCSHCIYPDKEDCSEYVERLEHYFTANDAPSSQLEDRPTATLVSPSKVMDFSFQDLVDKSQADFNLKSSRIVKWYEFNTRRRGEDKAIATYVAELRKIAEYC